MTHYFHLGSRGTKIRAQIPVITAVSIAISWLDSYRQGRRLKAAAAMQLCERIQAKENTIGKQIREKSRYAFQRIPRPGSPDGFIQTDNLPKRRLR